MTRKPTKEPGPSRRRSSTRQRSLGLSCTLLYWTARNGRQHLLGGRSWRNMTARAREVLKKPKGIDRFFLNHRLSTHDPPEWRTHRSLRNPRHSRRRWHGRGVSG